MDLSSLNINGPAILINVIGVILLLLVLNGTAFKPIGKVITERQEEIATDYNKVDAVKAEMESTRDSYQKRLAAIEEERRETVARAINEAQTTRDQIVHEATARAQELVSRAEQEVAREREQALISMRTEIVDLALNAATRMIGESLDTPKQRKLIDDFIVSSGVIASPVPALPAAAEA